jgi:hypothetical protein
MKITAFHEQLVPSVPQLRPLVLVAIVLLAGCTSPSGGGGAPVVYEGPSEEYQEPQTENTSVEVKSKENVTSEQKQELNSSIQEYVAGFYQSVNNSSYVAKSASGICNITNETGDAINGTANLTEVSGDIEHVVRRSQYFSEVSNELLATSISTSDLQKVRQEAGEVSKYTPILGSYQRVSNTSCALSTLEKGEDGYNETKRDYYISLATMGTDMVLLQQQIFYKTAFRLTGMSNAKFGLARIRSYCGDRCYAFALSEVHYAVRGSMHRAKNFVADSMVGLNESEVDWEFVNSSKNLKNHAVNMTASLSGVVGNLTANSSEASPIGVVAGAVGNNSSGDGSLNDSLFANSTQKAKEMVNETVNSTNVTSAVGNVTQGAKSAVDNLENKTDSKNASEIVDGIFG